MKVAWLTDPANADGSKGGAEMTAEEFRQAAPKDIEVVPVAADQLNRVAACDAACVFNSVFYPPTTIRALAGKRVIRYWSDVAPHGDAELKGWFCDRAVSVFTSPLHRERFPLPVKHAEVIPPALDLRSFRPNRQTKRHTERKGNVSIGAWQNPGKGHQLLREWSDENGLLKVYGSGPYIPIGPNIQYEGPLSPERIPTVLWGAKTFVHLPTSLEPFGRCVVEAWAAGCDLVINDLVGARHYIENDQDGLESAAGDFWRVVTG